MKLQKTIAVLSLGAMLIGPSTPAFAVSKEMIQLQTQVQQLADNMARMQQSFDERMGVMRNLVEQDTDNVNKLSVAVNNLQKTLQQQSTDSQTKVDQVSGQIQTLNDSIDELKARLARVSKQLDDMQNSQQNLAAATPAPGTAPGTAPGNVAGSTQAPPPGTLYDNALRDYTAARYDLALQQFADYLKFYPTTDLAGNAQYYIADIEYKQGNFEAAVKDFDKVLEQFPGGNKAAAAQLKKGYALLELGQRDAGVRELNALIQRYPKTNEAMQARDRLHKLGVGTGTTQSKKR
ncbi:MAG TPA: tetratricopeptide repeat protein [Candidatus Acidoferrales bacterium]|nr:tetratricopeptide repeat protein [Candidatus Acidoferrales bacterium]